MGNLFATLQTKHLKLESGAVPSYEPDVGFCKKRKKREFLACEEHLVSARILPKHRDYCAHLLLDYHVCRYKKFPLVYRCAHEKHAYLNCEHDDYVLRMKEFERERRLLERELRIKRKNAAKDHCKD